MWQHSFRLTLETRNTTSIVAQGGCERIMHNTNSKVCVILGGTSFFQRKNFPCEKKFRGTEQNVK